MTRHLNQTLLLPQDRMDQCAIGIIGQGAIGSFVSMALTKMGFKNVIVWDHDKYEEHNIPTQMCPIDGVGKRKVIVARDMVKQFSGEDIIAVATKVTGEKAYDYLSDTFPSHKLIMIMAVDSLDVRRALVEGFRKAYGLWVVDARMGAKTYRVMTFWPDHADQFTDYMSTLVSDADAVQERCGQKSIIYTVLGVAAEVCAFVHSIAMQDEGGINTSPHPVIFDYGTGIRMQERRVQGETLDFTDDAPPVPEIVLGEPVTHARGINAYIADQRGNDPF